VLLLGVSYIYQRDLLNLRGQHTPETGHGADQETHETGFRSASAACQHRISRDPVFSLRAPVENVGQKSGQVCLRIDAGIFANASPGLADLRLYHDQTENPYVIRVARAVEGSEKSIAVLNLGTRGGRTVFDTRMSGADFSDVQLDVEAKDFIATVAVSGSSALAGSAQTKLGSFTIFDLARQRLGRSTVLHLPESEFAFLHFSINGPLVPADITGLSVERLPSNQPAYETVTESAQVSRKGHSSIVEINVPRIRP